MANTIKISDRMADTVLAAVKRDSGEYLVRGPVGTVVALMDRGLVGVHLVREAGQVGHRVHTLTKHGVWVRRIIGNIYLQRSFDLAGLDEKMVAILAGETQEAPVVAEPTTPRPTMKRINITPKMVEALENTIEINGRRAMIMSHPKTQAALVPRGLADQHGFLTDQGRFVARQISLGSLQRSWSWDTLEAGTRTWLSDQKRHAEAAKPKTIKRVVNGRLVEMPAHREAAAYLTEAAPTLEDIELDSDEADREDARREESTVECECGAQWPTGVMGEGHNDMDCTTASQRMKASATEYSVKIWYLSDTYEGVSHCPEDLARKIFADAVKSPGVEFAELHGPDRMLVESHPRAEEHPVTTEPEQPDENLFLAGLPLLHPEPLPPAPELPQEPEPTA